MIRVVNPNDRRTGLRRNLRRSLLVGTLLGSLALADPTRADPISTAIALALPIGTSSAVASLVIATFWTTVQFAASAALSGIMAKKAQAGERDRQGNVLTLQMGEVPREFVVGRACSGGSLVNAFNGGGLHGTDHETQVIALADHECDALEGFYIDDAYHEFTGDGAVVGEDGLEVHWRSGTESQTFPASLKTGSGWDGDDNLAGVAHVWVRYTADWVEERRGRAAFRFVIRGAKLYDPRLDDTVDGGSGPHRWDPPTSRTWSENAYLGRYNFARGIYACNRVDDLGELLLGRGMTAIEAPPERAIAYANICDEDVALKGGGTEKRYTVGGVIRADQPFIDVEQWFADAMGGVIIQPEGGVDVEPGAAKSVVAEITDADLAVGETVKVRDFRAEPRKVNTVTARYPEPDQAWNDHDAPIRRDTADLIADRRPLVAPLTFPIVTSGTQVQRLMEIRRLSSRLERAYEIVLPPRFQRYEDGDWIGWTSDRYFDGARVVFRIEARQRREERRVAWRLEEISADSYVWTAADDEITPGTAPPTPSTPAGALTLSGAAASVVTQGGVPFLRFSWTPPTDPAIRTVTVEARVSGQTQAATSTTDEPSRGTLDLTNGVAPNTLMQWRMYPRGATGRAYTPTAWTDITVGTLTAGDTGIDGSSPTTDHPPSWYRAKGVKVTQEVKDAGSLGISFPGELGSLTTTVTSSSTSVPIQQRFLLYGARTRVSTSEIAWGPWVLAFDEDRKPSWDTDILGRALELTDGRIAAGLNANGDLLRDILTARANSSGLLRYTGGGLYAGHLSATLGARAGTNLFRTDGSTILSQAEVRTLEGTAAVALLLNGEGALARQNTVLPTQFAPTGGNRVVDVDFVQDAYWLVSAPSRGITIDRALAQLAVMGAIGGIRAESDATTTQLTGSALPTAYYDVSPGQVWQFTAQRFWSTGFNGYAQVRIYHYDSAKGLMGSTLIAGTDMRAAPSAGNEYGEWSAPYVVPTGAAYVRVYLMFVVWPTAVASAGRYLVARPQFRRSYRLGATGGLLLEDGVTPATDLRLVTAQGRSAGTNVGAQAVRSNGFSPPSGSQPEIFERADAASITLSPAHAVTPQFQVQQDNFDAPLSGEYARARVTGASAAGGTVEAKWVDPGSSPVYTARSDDGGGGLVGTAPAESLERHKALSGIAYDDEYVFTGEVEADVLPDPEGISDYVYVPVDAFCRTTSGGAWVLVGTHLVPLLRPASFPAAYRSATFEIRGVFDVASFPVHAGTEYKVAVGYSADTLNPKIKAFTAVTYLEQTGGGAASERSALSGGRLAKVVVISKDG